MLRKKDILIKGGTHRVDFALVDEKRKLAVSYFAYMHYGPGHQVVVSTGSTTYHQPNPIYNDPSLEKERDCEHIGRCYCDGHTESTNLTMDWLMKGDEVIWQLLENRMERLVEDNKPHEGDLSDQRLVPGSLLGR
jgi:hypothetical protein